MKNLYDFIIESNMIEGIFDQPTPELIEAYETFLSLEKPRVSDLVHFVKVTQPDAVLRDNMSVPGVRVGNHIAPRSGPEIREQLQYLLDCAYADTGANDAWQIHCDYETLHPFTDGNGRSGRLLWLWCHCGRAPLGFLHSFYYQTLANYRL